MNSTLDRIMNVLLQARPLLIVCSNASGYFVLFESPNGGFLLSITDELDSEARANEGGSIKGLGECGILLLSCNDSLLRLLRRNTSSSIITWKKTGDRLKDKCESPGRPKLPGFG